MNGYPSAHNFLPKTIKGIEDRAWTGICVSLSPLNPRVFNICESDSFLKDTQSVHKPISSACANKNIPDHTLYVKDDHSFYAF